ncbi:MAG: Transcriptional regulator [Pseudomonadota bacterium]
MPPTSKRTRRAGTKVPIAGRHALAELEPRRAPVQKRAQLSVQRILEAAGALLDDVGLERVTTELIAQRAGVNVATVYKYFPNKHAVLAELYRTHYEPRLAHFGGVMAVIAAGGDWRKAIDEGLDLSTRDRRARKGTLSIRLAVRSSPDLHRLERKNLEHRTEVFAAVLVRAGAARPAQARVVAHCLLEVVATLLDVWNMSPEMQGPAYLAEMKRIAKTLLGEYLDNRQPMTVKAGRKTSAKQTAK